MVFDSWMPAIQMTAAPATKTTTSSQSGSDPMPSTVDPACRDRSEPRVERLGRRFVGR